MIKENMIVGIYSFSINSATSTEYEYMLYTKLSAFKTDIENGFEQIKRIEEQLEELPGSEYNKLFGC